MYKVITKLCSKPFILVCLGFFYVVTAFAQPIGPINLRPATIGINAPVGIDHHHPTNQVVMSVNYPTGRPYNFELVSLDGRRSQFSNISGLTEEVKIATARDEGGGMSRGGFSAGELFTGTGTGGHIARISPDGSIIRNPWVILPGETGLLRGSLYVDRTGVFAGDLIVVTTAGNVWRVNSSGAIVHPSGNPNPLARIGTHLEGVVTIPSDTVKYGPWAGKIVIGAEGQARVYTVDSRGTVSFFNLGIRPEDIDLIPANENFFGIDYGRQILWTASPAEFVNMIGDVLIADESGPLYHVRWNNSDQRFQVTQIARVTQWEHVTFSTTPICKAKFTAPNDNTVTCDDSIKVCIEAQLNVGVPPITKECQINGIPISDSCAFVPLVHGNNSLIATCTFTDATGYKVVCADTISVLSDPTPPTATFNFNNLPIITGEVRDDESGIAKIEIVEINNRVVTISPFTVGDKRVTFSSDKIDPNLRSGFMLRITNRAGCSVLADPVYVKLDPAAGRSEFSFNMQHTDRFLYVNNHGLPKIHVMLNGRPLNLVANAEGEGRSGSTFFMMKEGQRLIDIASYLHEGENQVQVKCDATASGYADLLFADVQLGEIDNSIILPTAFALNQNYPNPFNPTTNIVFDIPENWTAPVTLRIFNMQGQLIQTLVDGVMQPGRHEVTWNGRDANAQLVATGMYFYQILSGEVKAVKKMQMVK